MFSKRTWQLVVLIGLIEFPLCCLEKISSFQLPVHIGVDSFNHSAAQFLVECGKNHPIAGFPFTPKKVFSKTTWRLVLLLSLINIPLCCSEKKSSSPSHVQVGVGAFNVIKPNYRTAQFLVEYRRNINFYNVRPLVAFTFTPKGSYYLCGGAAWDIFLGKHVVLTPSFAPGLYVRGRGKDLGFPLEFRSSIELAAVLPNKGRIGAQFYHISNASLGHKNPGSESLILFYAIPLN